jgi:gas vesicle protein
MAPVPATVQYTPPLQGNFGAIEPWYLDDMSVLERQGKDFLNNFAEQAEYSKLSTEAHLGKRSILEEQDLEWYFDDLLDDLSSKLAKRGNYNPQDPLRSRIWQCLGNVKDKVEDAANGAKDAAGNAADKVKDAADDVKSGVKDAADTVKDHAGKVEDKASDVSEHSKDGGCLERCEGCSQGYSQKAQRRHQEGWSTQVNIRKRRKNTEICRGDYNLSDFFFKTIQFIHTRWDLWYLCY